MSYERFGVLEGPIFRPTLGHINSLLRSKRRHPSFGSPPYGRRPLSLRSGHRSPCSCRGSIRARPEPTRVSFGCHKLTGVQGQLVFGHLVSRHAIRRGPSRAALRSLRRHVDDHPDGGVCGSCLPHQYGRDACRGVHPAAAGSGSGQRVVCRLTKADNGASQIRGRRAAAEVLISRISSRSAPASDETGAGARRCR